MSDDVADLMQVVESTARIEERQRRRAFGVTVAVVVLAGLWLVLSVLAAGKLESQKSAAEQTLAGLRSERTKIEAELKTKQGEREEVAKALEKSQVALLETQAGFAAQQQAITGFLLEAMDSSEVKRIGPSVDWKAVQAEVSALKPGRRQSAVLIALLSTWKEVRYQSGGKTLEATDGQRFVDLVISKAGLPPTTVGDNERASVALMRRFHAQTSNPQPGDLMFFRSKGACRVDGGGNACCMYLAPGKPGGPGICVGLPIMLSTRAAQVLDTGSRDDGIVSQCEFIGYFHVPYEEHGR